MDLTKRQQEIFDFIKRYSAKYGYPPTVRDIGKAVGLASSSTVHAHLANLERIGMLRRDPTKPRAIELLDRAAAGVRGVRQPGPAARRPGRRRPADARRGEHRGVHPDAGVRGRRGRRVSAARARRVDEGRRDPRGRPGRRAAAGHRRATARSSSRSSARRRPSSASSRRPTTSGCSPRTRRWSRSRSRDVRVLGRVVGLMRNIS